MILEIKEKLTQMTENQKHNRREQKKQRIKDETAQEALKLNDEDKKKEEKRTHLHMCRPDGRQPD